MDYKVECTIDTNDADYNTEISKINDKELIMLKDICSRIKSFKPYKGTHKDGSIFTHDNNFSDGECLREDLGEIDPIKLYNLTEEEYEFFVFKICPSCEYGFHTIENVVIYPYVEGEALI